MPMMNWRATEQAGANGKGLRRLTQQDRVDGRG
jgi:hypothetical protein